MLINLNSQKFTLLAMPELDWRVEVVICYDESIGYANSKWYYLL